MSFRENLQHLRATRNMTQEQLALLLGVSRQAVSKWEAERAYPEMDKLQKLCSIFGCTIDELVSGDLTGRASEPELSVPASAAATDTTGYDAHMKCRAALIALGVGAVIAGLAVSSLAGGTSAFWYAIIVGSAPSVAASVMVLAGALVGAALIVPACIRHAAFVRSHPYVADFYTDADRRRARAMRPVGIAALAVALAAGVALQLFWAANFNAALGTFWLLLCAAVGAMALVGSFLFAARVNVAGYNARMAARELALEDAVRFDSAMPAADPNGDAASDAEAAQLHRETLLAARRLRIRKNALTAIIMLAATAVALVLLFALQSSLFWLAWVIGALAAVIARITAGLHSNMR